MTYYCATANTEAKANQLAAALHEVGCDVTGMVREAAGDYAGGLLVTLHTEHYPSEVWQAMQANCDVCATLADVAAVGAWINTNYVGDPPTSV